MRKIIGSLVFLQCVLMGCSQNTLEGYKKLKITQTVVMLRKEKTVIKDTLSDFVIIITTKKDNKIRIAQLPVYPIDIVDTSAINKSPVLDYFVYSTSMHTGLYFKKLQGLADFVYPVDSVMQLKADKYYGIDTLRCLKEQPVIYIDNTKDWIYSYPNKIKTDENYDFDSVRFVYTDNKRLKNEYLSKLIGIKDGHFLYKVIFYFKQTFDKRINDTLPERDIKIEISESNNFDKEDLEKVLAKYKMIFR